MRILDERTDKPIKRILVLLTPEEAGELRDSLEHLLAQPNHHLHVADAAFEREITLAIYTPDNLGSFHERVRLLIEQEK